jgi:hypothetical protein
MPIKSQPSSKAYQPSANSQKGPSLRPDGYRDSPIKNRNAKSRSNLHLNAKKQFSSKARTK